MYLHACSSVSKLTIAPLAYCPYAFENELVYTSAMAQQCSSSLPPLLYVWACLCRVAFPCKGLGVLLKVHRY